MQVRPTGLIEHLKITLHKLATSECKTRKFDEIFSSNIQFPSVESGNKKTLKFGDAIIELFKMFVPHDIARLSLQSAVFRDYMDERAYRFLTDYQDKSNEEFLYIILHLLKKDEISPANALINQIQRDDLSELLMTYWNILFEFSTHSEMKKIPKTIISFSDFTELLFLTSSLPERCDLLTNVLLHHIYETKKIQFHSILKLLMEYLASQFGHDSYTNGQNVLKMLLEKYLQKYYDKKSNADNDISMLSTSSSNAVTTLSAPEDVGYQKNDRHYEFSWDEDSMNNSSAHRYAMKLLIRIYLSQLKVLSMKQVKKPNPDLKSINKAQLIKVIDEMSTSLFVNLKPVSKFDKVAAALIQYTNDNPGSKSILFLDERLRYLDWMPPFENFLQVLSSDDADDTSQYDYNTMDNELLITLIKIQAILSSGEMSSDMNKEVLNFLESNKKMIGAESILVCLLPLQEAIDVIIKTNPQCVLEYARCHFKMDEDWIYLIQSLQKKVNEFEVIESNTGHVLFYHRLLKETLEHLTATKSLDKIMKIFPQEKNLINEELFKMVQSRNSNQFDDYLKKVIDKERSEKIRNMIENTGGQLFEAINKN